MVTGPDFSGKSVYVHHVGPFVILAQIGSAVPSDRTQLSPMRHNNDRLRSFDSTGHGHFLFFEESSQVSPTFEKLSRCLNLMDAFWHGLPKVDGNTILVATLGRLLEKGREKGSDVLHDSFVGLERSRFY